MFDRIYQSVWITLDKKVRQHLTGVFNIPSSGPSEIFDQKVVKDGKTEDDLMAISLDKMKKYVGIDETFPKLWELTVLQAIKELEPIKKYCETCDSTKGRHQKGCPKYK